MKPAYLVLCLLPLLLGACASNSDSGTTPAMAASQRASGSFKPVKGTAGLYIFKEGAVMTAAESRQIKVDGRVLGLVAAGAYIYDTLPPGPHMITCGAGVLTLNVVANQNYFVRQVPSSLNASGMSTPPQLVLEPADSGLQIIKQMQRANFAH